MVDFYSEFRNDLKRFLSGEMPAAPDDRPPLFYLSDVLQEDLGDIVWLEYEPGDPLGFFEEHLLQNFEKFYCDFGVDFGPDCKLEEAAIIDILYGLLICKSLESPDRPPFCTEVPRLWLRFGDKQAEFVADMGLLALMTTQKAGDVIDNRLMFTVTFLQKAKITAGEFLEGLPALLPLFNAFILADTDRGPVQFDPVFNENPALNGELGWFRLHRLLDSAGLTSLERECLAEEEYYGSLIDGLTALVDLFENLLGDEERKLSAEMIDWNTQIYT